MQTKTNWLIEGIIFGIIMLVFSSIIELINDDFSLVGLWKKVLIWFAGGLLFGLIMKYIRGLR